MNEIEQAIENLEYFIGGDCCDNQMDFLEEIGMGIAALREKSDFVRCEYCEYWQDNNGGYPHEECRWGHDETPDADDFCSCGKRLEVEL